MPTIDRRRMPRLRAHDAQNFFDDAVHRLALQSSVYWRTTQFVTV